MFVFVFSWLGCCSHVVTCDIHSIFLFPSFRFTRLRPFHLSGSNEPVVFAWGLTLHFYIFGILGACPPSPHPFLSKYLSSETVEEPRIVVAVWFRSVVQTLLYFFKPSCTCTFHANGIPSLTECRVIVAKNYWEMPTRRICDR